MRTVYEASLLQDTEHLCRLAADAVATVYCQKACLYGKYESGILLTFPSDSLHDSK